jgi:transposase, IS5 family
MGDFVMEIWTKQLVKASPIQNQLNMFKVLLTEMIAPGHELVRLASEIRWSSFDQEFGRLYSTTGRPGHPIRRMVGFLILKQLYNQSDENVVARWVENPYWQHFTGEEFFQHRAPFDPSELVHFRKRIGPEGAELVFKESVRLHAQDALEDEVVVDTTVQEKNITFPTDAKLRRKIVDKCIGIARREGVRLSRTYAKERKALLLMLRFGSHPKRKRMARKAGKRLLTIAGRLLRDLRRKLAAVGRERAHGETLDLFARVLAQKRKDKNKVYSLHEPRVSCIAKGKEHKPYEFGSKVSIATTRRKGVAVGILAFEGNPYDGNTLAPTLDQVERVTGKRPADATCDRGYRGRKLAGSTRVHVPQAPPPTATKAQKKEARRRFGRRAAIEPRIAHLKHDYRMGRNFLKGVAGDTFNALMSATAWNLRLWIMGLSMLAALLQRLMQPLSSAILHSSRYFNTMNPHHPQNPTLCHPNTNAT